MKNSLNYFFIVGCARSGTSILGELIQSHPDVKYIFEASQIWETAGHGENDSHRLIARHATTNTAQNIRTWIEQQTDDKSILVQKSPRNSLRIPFIRQIFPDAKFIHIIRDGRDAACSMVPGCGGSEWNHLKPPSWKNLFENHSGALRCAHVWKETLEITLNDLAAVPHLQIHYEDLIATPYDTAKKIFEFIGLETHPLTLGFCKKISNQTNAPHHAAYQSRWYRDDHKIRIGRWRENLTPNEQESIQTLLEPLLTKLNYLESNAQKKLQASNRKKLVVILGMHRSGTSVFARSLKVMNIDLGDNLMSPVKDNNDKGFWEDLDIFSLNEQMLSALSSSWHHLRPISHPELAHLEKLGFLEQAKRLLREKTSSSHFFGIKDPRIPRLLPFWKQVFVALNLDVSYIITLRHPLSVAESLARRDGFSKEKGIIMWIDHMLACLIETKGEHRILANYDDLLEKPANVLLSLSEFLEREINQNELAKFKEEFLDKNLRHHIFSIENLETDDSTLLIVSELYEELLNCHLSTINLNNDALAQKIHQWQESLKEQKSAWDLINHMTSEINDTKKQITQRDAQITQRDAQITQRDAQIAESKQQLVEIQRSKAWMTMLWMRKVRVLIAPPGSLRARLGCKLLFIFTIFPIIIRKIASGLHLLKTEGIVSFSQKIFSTIKINYPKLNQKPYQRHVNTTVSIRTDAPSLLINQKWEARTPVLSKFPATESPIRILPKRIRNHALRVVQEHPITISVIIATWNRADTICNAVQSVLAQSYPATEIIISDDGSSDNTIDFIKQNFLEQIEAGQIILLKNSHKGVCYARNRALELAKSELITYLDSDNTWQKDYLLLVATVYTENDEITTAYAALESIDIPNNTKNILFSQYNRHLLLSQNYIDLNVFSHRRKIIQQQGLFDVNLTRLVDWELIIRYTHNYAPARIPYIGAIYNLDKDKLRNITYTQPLDTNKDYVYKKHILERLELGIAPLKLAYVIWDFPSLSQTFVMHELRWLVSNGYDVIVYYHTAPEYKYNVDFSIATYQVKDKNDLAKLLVEHERNYCHSHFVYPAVTLLTFPACEQIGIPFTFMPHAVDLFHHDNRKRNRIKEITEHPLCQKIFVYGDFHKNFLINQGAPPIKIFYAFQAIDINITETPRTLSHLSEQKKELCGITIARFIEKKGIPYLLQAAKQVEHLPVRFEIYGFGPLRESYEEQIRTLDIKNVKILPEINSEQELNQVYEQADFLIVPSVIAQNGDMDGFPTVILEAMAHNLPVLTTNVSALPDYLRDSVNAMVVNPGNPEELVSGITRLTALSQNEQRALTYRAQKFIKEKIGVEKTVQALLDVWLNRTIDIILVTYNTPQYDLKNETFEILQRVIDNTTTPYNLILIDNNSEPEFSEKLFLIAQKAKNLTFIQKKNNILLGPATNAALRMGRAKYAIYLCSKEAFVKSTGWERNLLQFMRDHKEIALAGHLSHLPKYTLGQDIHKHPDFAKFRNQNFAKQNPTKPFIHVQGGVFIADRLTLLSEGSFNNEIPQSNMDVELSYYLESKGYKLGSIPSVASITTKTRPQIHALIDEYTDVAHPLSLQNLKNVFDSVGKDGMLFCNICGQKCQKFTDKDNESICPSCQSTGFGRLAFKLLASDHHIHRGLKTFFLGNDQSFYNELKAMFGTAIIVGTHLELETHLKNGDWDCIILQPNLVTGITKKLWDLMAKQLTVNGLLLRGDNFSTNMETVFQLPIDKFNSAENNGDKFKFQVELIDYQSFQLGFGPNRIWKYIKH